MRAAISTVFSVIKAMKKQLITFFLVVPSVQNDGIMLEFIGATTWIFFTMIEAARGAFGHNFFMDVLAVVVWCIWKQRNDFIFRNTTPSFLFGRAASMPC
jgi:predicted HAD superfamily hydrolase